MLEKKHILLVVDDESDHLLLFKRALQGHPLIKEIKAFNAGQPALDCLRDCLLGGKAGCQFPSLVFLDLKMPGMDGFEVLRQIRAEAVIRRIPVIMLTTSQEETDVATSYELKANSFIHKPVDFLVFKQQLHDTVQYWLEANQLPF